MISKILCDADFLIALFVQDDSNHKKAFEIYNSFDSSYFVFTNLAIYETATVLSRKLEHDDAIFTLESIRNRFCNPIVFDTKWESDIFDIFNSYSKKNISFFDCSCLFIAQKFNYKIASFDKFYPKEILIGM
jgi:predicted nucleic acid-binding protein